MDTDQLIRTLAADNTHRARPVGFALMLALLAAAPVSLLMFFTELGVRPDVMVAMRNPFFDLKFAVTLALAIAAITVSLHLSRPEASLRGFGWLLLAPVGILTAAIGGEMMMPQRLPMMTRLVGKNWWICLMAIPLMSLPLLAGALIGLRHGAPARPAVAGAIAGLLSAGLAATVSADEEEPSVGHFGRELHRLLQQDDRAVVIAADRQLARSVVVVLCDRSLRQLLLDRPIA